MKNSNRYYVIGRTIQDHKFVWNMLWTITFIIFIPFGIFQLLGEIFDKIAEFGATIRSSIVYIIFMLLYKKECLYSEDNDG